MKTEVYSWRVSPEVKMALEEAARTEKVSVAQLLDLAVTAWLEERGAQAKHDEEQQCRIREEVAKYIGSLHSGDPGLAEQASERVRARLMKKHARQRAD